MRARAGLKPAPTCTPFAHGEIDGHSIFRNPTDPTPTARFARGPTPPPTGHTVRNECATLLPKARRDARPPTPRPGEADVGAGRRGGFQPARRTRKEARPPTPRPRTTRTAQGEVVPTGFTGRPPPTNPHRRTRKEARPPTPRPKEADVGAGFKPAPTSASSGPAWGAGPPCGFTVGRSWLVVGGSVGPTEGGDFALGCSAGAGDGRV